jgi:hypothetical protein
MQNLMISIDGVQQHGLVATTVEARVKSLMVATRTPTTTIVANNAMAMTLTAAVTAPRWICFSEFSSAEHAYPRA